MEFSLSITIPSHVFFILLQYYDRTRSMFGYIYIANPISGMAYCGAVGHAARKYYAIIGPPVDRSIGIMDISYDKVTTSLIILSYLIFIDSFVYFLSECMIYRVNIFHEIILRISRIFCMLVHKIHSYLFLVTHKYENILTHSYQRIENLQIQP